MTINATGRSTQWISNNMRAVRSKDSKAERRIRSALHRLGFRFKKHANLPGRPDILFVSAKTAVFVDGDFWHGRVLIENGEDVLKQTFRSAKADWWIAKIKATVQRDREIDRVLHTLGYVTLRLWERDILADTDRAAQMIKQVLIHRRALIRSHSESSKPTRDSLSPNC